ncbi:hypothetical protein B0H14DRAFT_3139755 [Mycena olivaceomarginata]|nr:hypothetical protein B0H14DRAFT_3139755 [Mycena olivaceomarginata]
MYVGVSAAQNFYSIIPVAHTYLPFDTSVTRFHLGFKYRQPKSSLCLLSKPPYTLRVVVTCIPFILFLRVICTPLATLDACPTPRAVPNILTSFLCAALEDFCSIFGAPPSKLLRIPAAIFEDRAIPEYRVGLGADEAKFSRQRERHSFRDAPHKTNECTHDGCTTTPPELPYFSHTMCTTFPTLSSTFHSLPSELVHRVHLYMIQAPALSIVSLRETSPMPLKVQNHDSKDPRPPRFKLCCGSASGHAREDYKESVNSDMAHRCWRILTIRDSDKDARFGLERKRQWRKTLVKLVSEGVGGKRRDVGSEKSLTRLTAADGTKAGPRGS